MLVPFNMGVEKLVIRPGNGIDFPKKHDEVSMEYTGEISYLIPHRRSTSNNNNNRMAI